MNHVSEHDDLYTAFGHQVAGLEIGPSPIAAVMRDGAALRTRRRAALVSGVATLAIVPVAAFAVFAGGPGGSDTPGAVPSSASSPKPADTSNPKPTGAPGTASSSGQRKTLPTPDVTMPAIPTSQSFAPDPHDEIKVLASGTYGGQHWRLIRQRFVVGPGKGEFVGAAGIDHLPLSQAGRNGDETCVFSGMQWGDRPPGTGPEYDAGGGCGDDKDMNTVAGLLGPTDMVIPPGGFGKVSTISGCVQYPAVVSVTVTLDDRVSTPVQVTPVAGEPIGCYALFVDPRAQSTKQSVVLTGYDGQGHTVTTLQMNHGATR